MRGRKEVKVVRARSLNRARALLPTCQRRAGKGELPQHRVSCTTLGSKHQHISLRLVLIGVRQVSH